MSNQLSIWDGSTPLKIDKPIRLIELFAGIGAQAKALERLGVPFEHYRICEFDKYAVKSYNAIHGTNFKASDVTKITADDLGIVDTDKYCYILTYSFPCTDLSLAGKQQGMAKGSGTRSGLLWEVERLLKELKELPQVLVMENVPEVIGQKNIKHFAEWIAFLDTHGYKSKWQVLNATDFNVPQNRRRCFMVSILGDYYYEFPKPIGCKLRLKDLLEKEVAERYYLPSTLIKYYENRNKEQREKGNGFFFEPTDGAGIAKSVLTRAGSRQCDNFVKIPICINSKVNGKQPSLQNRIYDTNGSATAATTAFMPKILINEPTICAMRGRNPDNPSDRTKGCTTEQRLEIGRDLSNTLTSVQKDNLVIFGSTQKHCSIRKLTPRECFRLMDFEDEDFDKVKAAGISDSQAYKQAGNSIVVAVIEAIFKQML